MAEKQSRVELRLHSHESEISLMPIDTALVGALHVEYLRERDLSGDEHLHHTLFQTSTVDALLEGKTRAMSASPNSGIVEISDWARSTLSTAR
jgi:hypothetical protein